MPTVPYPGAVLQSVFFGKTVEVIELGSGHGGLQRIKRIVPSQCIGIVFARGIGLEYLAIYSYHLGPVFGLHFSVQQNSAFAAGGQIFCDIRLKAEASPKLPKSFPSSEAPGA